MRLKDHIVRIDHINLLLRSPPTQCHCGRYGQKMSLLVETISHMTRKRGHMTRSHDLLTHQLWLMLLRSQVSMETSPVSWQHKRNVCSSLADRGCLWCLGLAKEIGHVWKAVRTLVTTTRYLRSPKRWGLKGAQMILHKNQWPCFHFLTLSRFPRNLGNKIPWLFHSFPRPN